MIYDKFYVSSTLFFKKGVIGHQHTFLLSTLYSEWPFNDV